MMKIAFVGLGSIAKRHIYNLSKVLVRRNEKFEIDVYRHGDTNLLDNQDDKIKGLVSSIYNDTELGEVQYDVIFITNPTSLHYETIRKSVKAARNLFIEKPVFDTSNVDISQLELNSESVYYVACPLRYNAVIQYIKNEINLKEVYSARAISSSYLPDWRPEKDYRNTYSAIRNLGGGVAIDLIHEWDYLTYLFGFPEKVLYAGGKFSKLEINSDDLAAYIGIYSDKLIELHLDYFGRGNIRELMLFTEDDVIQADLVKNKITYKKSGKILDFFEDRDVYQQREIEHFLDIINGKYKNENDIWNAVRVLKLTGN